MTKHSSKKRLWQSLLWLWVFVPTSCSCHQPWTHPSICCSSESEIHVADSKLSPAELSQDKDSQVRNKCPLVQATEILELVVMLITPEKLDEYRNQSAYVNIYTVAVIMKNWSFLCLVSILPLDFSFHFLRNPNNQVSLASLAPSLLDTFHHFKHDQFLLAFIKI